MFNKLQNVNIDCVYKWIILCVGFTSDNAGCAYLKAENTNNNNNVPVGRDLLMGKSMTFTVNFIISFPGQMEASLSQFPRQSYYN